MKFADRLKVTATGTSAATLNLGAAALGCRTLAQAIADGDLATTDTGIPFTVDDGAGNWEDSLFTITSTTQITRTSVLRSNVGGTTPATFSGSTLTVFNCVPAAFLTGTSLADWLAANPGSALANTDLILFAQGQNVVGKALSAAADAINKLWPSAYGGQVAIASTAQFPLDFSTHNRRRLVCTATPAKITAPTAFGNVGNGFECTIMNLSGADITLEGITVRPSGAVVPAGASADICATGGSIYATLYGTSAATSSGGTGVTAPGAVSGLTAGTATDTTQPLTWTAPATGTAPFTYKVEYKKTSDTDWTTAATGVSGTSYTVTGLLASTSYDYRVSASNSAGTGAVATITGKSTAAAASGGGGAGTGTAPFSVVAASDFPVSLASGVNDFLWTNITKTGTATIVSAKAALSRSSSVAPTSSIGQGTTPEGAWIGSLFNYGAPSANWIVYNSAGYTDGTQVGGISWSESNRDYFYWIFITDSDGFVWTFMKTTAITIGNTASTVKTGASTAFTQK